MGLLWDQCGFVNSACETQLSAELTYGPKTLLSFVPNGILLHVVRRTVLWRMWPVSCGDCERVEEGKGHGAGGRAFDS